MVPKKQNAPKIQLRPWVKPKTTKSLPNEMSVVISPIHPLLQPPWGREIVASLWELGMRAGAKCTNPLRSQHSWTLQPTGVHPVPSRIRQIGASSSDPFPWENISSSPSLNQASGVGNAVPSGWSTLCAAFCQKCSDLFFSLDFLIFLTSCTGVCPAEAQEQKL